MTEPAKPATPAGSAESARSEPATPAGSTSRPATPAAPADRPATPAGSASRAGESARPTEVVDRFLRAMVSPDPGGMADVYAERVVLEMPFMPASLSPGRIETTREELRARFRAGRVARVYSRAENVVVHETADPEVIILEYDLHGELRPAGTPFVQSFVLVMTVRDGAIVHSRDYTDPITGARLLGRVPELVAELTSTA